MNNFKYQTIRSVHNRALKAKNKPMIELNDNVPLKGKSSIGDTFEHWFGKEKDNISEPDLSEAGVELKATPYFFNKHHFYSAKERLVLNMIDYKRLINENFMNSHFLHKNKNLEIAFYKSEKNISKNDFKFTDIILYKMLENKKDIKVIKNDWEIIQKYVLEGKADQINEGITNYLSPCEKGSSSKNIREQPFSDKLAKPRAFSFKVGYMNNLLRNYVKGNKHSESIISDELPNQSLNKIILDKFNRYKNISINKLLSEHKINIKRYKSYNYQAASIMLGLKDSYTNSNSFDSVEELEKSNIKIKTISFNCDNKNNQSMSLPYFKFDDIIKENWKNSKLRQYFIQTNFLFFVTKSDTKKGNKGNIMFKGAKLFHIPDKVLDTDIKKVWLDTVKKIKEGVILKAKRNRNGHIRISNNFIDVKARQVCHVRPHTSCVDYSIDGSNSFKLPHNINWINRPSNHDKYSSNRMTRQSFWLNNSYIKNQVKDLLY